MATNLQQAQHDVDRAEIKIRSADARLAQLLREHISALTLLREAESYANRALSDDPTVYARRYAQTEGPRERLAALKASIAEAERDVEAAKEAARGPREAAMRAYRASLDMLAERLEMGISEVQPAIATISKFHSEVGLLLSEADVAKRMIGALSAHVRVESDGSGARYAANEQRARQLLEAAPIYLNHIVDRKLRGEVEASGNIS